jgi:hypothetical protein
MLKTFSAGRRGCSICAVVRVVLSSKMDGQWLTYLVAFTILSIKILERILGFPAQFRLHDND